VYIDPDPISVLRGGPQPELARRFIEYVLTERGQSVWNFEPIESTPKEAHVLDDNGDEMGPAVYALRRLPVRRVMYEKHFDHFMDRVNPYLIAGSDRPAGWRSSIGPMMGAFGIDTDVELKAAWKALNEARADESFPSEVLAEMESIFYAMPIHQMPPDKVGQPGELLEFTPENYRAIRNSWRDPDHPDWAVKSQIRYVEFFQEKYAQVVRLAKTRALEPAGIQ